MKRKRAEREEYLDEVIEELKIQLKDVGIQGGFIRTT